MCADRWLLNWSRAGGWGEAKLVMGTGPGWLEVLFGESETIVSVQGSLWYIIGRYLFGMEKVELS